MPSSSLSSPKEALLASKGSGVRDDNNNDDDVFDDEELLYVVSKRKRTKRQRVHHLVSLASATTSSTTLSVGSRGTITAEDEDLANCLILLARGPKVEQREIDRKHHDSEDVSRRFRDVVKTTSLNDSGYCAYECKTCNKRFPSFQALGGHRTSHRKPKIASIAKSPVAEEKKPQEEYYNLQTSPTHYSKEILISSNNDCNKSRVHQCSICGSEFSSGQALGGHMRRHRPLNVARSSPQPMNEKSLLSLDLNLPAPPEGDDGDFHKSSSTSSAFTFNPSTDTPRVVISSMVDCYY